MHVCLLVWTSCYHLVFSLSVSLVAPRLINVFRFAHSQTQVNFPRCLDRTLPVTV